MDDPIVALSLWSSSSNQPPNNSNSKVTGAGNNTSSEKEMKENKSDAAHKSKSNGSSSGDCFPCLPTLDIPDSSRTVHNNSNTKQSDELQPPSNETPPPQLQSGVIDKNKTTNCEASSPQSSPQLSNSLVRLFESNMFTIELALQYLYNEKDRNVQEYLGKKLIMFQAEDVDFYLLQLVAMFIHIDGLSSILQRYFLQRCQYDVTFSLQLAWLLNSNINDSWLPQEKLYKASKMLHVIKNDQIRPPQSALIPRSDNASRHTVCHSSSEVNVSDKSHHRSLSASKISPPLKYLLAVDGNNSTGGKISLGDLRSGRAFDSGCACLVSTTHVLPGNNIPVCSCSAPRLSAQDFFLHTLGNISSKLLKYPTKALKTSHLYAELSQINLNLPARICLPLHATPHQVVRIPASEAVVLNSKCKAPYIILVEVLECDNTYLSPLPDKHLESGVQGIGLSPSEAKHYIHSEGPSPSNTRVSSMPSLKCGGGGGSSNYHESVSLHSSELSEYDELSEQKEEVSDEDDKILFCRKEDTSVSPIDKDDDSDEPTTFSVGDIRRRLTQESILPGKMFSRDPQDPSASAMKEPWDSKISRIRKSSPYGYLPNWKLVAAIIKWGDDLRQEMMCWQLLVQFKNVWNKENVPLWIRPYKVMVVSSEGGLIEPICNAVSLHQIKKQRNMSLVDYFIHEFGDRNSESFLSAQKNFVESCAAYCLVCYFIQVKDRHNGNILLDSFGRIIHIDFGFILAHSPGNNMRFESSPFKLTEEFVDVMGGVNSDMYNYFKFLMLRGFLAARKHMDRFINIVKITQTGSKLLCFGNGPATVQEMEKRFCLNLTEEQLERFVNKMVENSMNSLTTKLYDGFQYFANGIL